MLTEDGIGVPPVATTKKHSRIAYRHNNRIYLGIFLSYRLETDIFSVMEYGYAKCDYESLRITVVPVTENVRSVGGESVVDSWEA